MTFQVTRVCVGRPMQATMQRMVVALMLHASSGYTLLAPRTTVSVRRGTACVMTSTLEPPTEDTVKVRDSLRNIAIVAHVDHGKTTLVDAMLESAKAIKGTESIGKDDRVMDSNDQEKERGITILAKNAALTYDGVKVNIVDTPGHADFGGEVERVLGMVDGVLLLVDAAEGPKPQTRFVLKKALAMGHKVLVVVNKIDKPAARPDYVIDKTFDLFCELGASDEQTDFPIVYTSAINRQSGFEPDSISEDMSAVFKRIMELPKPKADADQPLQLQISNIGSDPFIGRLGIGRIKAGKLKKNTPIGISEGPGTKVWAVQYPTTTINAVLLTMMMALLGVPVLSAGAAGQGVRVVQLRCRRACTDRLSLSRRDCGLLGHS